MGQIRSKEPDYVGPLSALERAVNFILSLKETIITGSNMISLSLFLRITVLNQSSPFDMEIDLGSSIPHHPTPYSFIIYINLFKAVINPTVH